VGIGYRSMGVVDSMVEFRHFRIQGVENVVTQSRELRTPDS
jgi:hypothetical protein